MSTSRFSGDMKPALAMSSISSPGLAATQLRQGGRQDRPAQAFGGADAEGSGDDVGLADPLGGGHGGLGVRARVQQSRAGRGQLQAGRGPGEQHGLERASRPAMRRFIVLASTPRARAALALLPARAVAMNTRKSSQSNMILLQAPVGRTSAQRGSGSDGRPGLSTSRGARRHAHQRM